MYDSHDNVFARAEWVTGGTAYQDYGISGRNLRNRLAEEIICTNLQPKTRS